MLTGLLRFSAVISFICAVAAVAVAAIPQGSSITYQGQLKSNGVPVNSSADIRATLWDAAMGGAAVPGTPTVQVNNVNVVNGLFTAALDFGSGAFNGDARWIQIEVRTPHDPGNAAAFTPLTPRQALTSTPYALQTRGIVVNAAGDVGIGSVSPEGKLHVLRNLAGVVTADSNSLLNIENSTNAYLTILTPDAGERGILFGEPSSNVAGGILYNSAGTPDGLQFRTNGNATRLVIDAQGEVGIGVTNPAAPLEIAFGGRILQMRNDGGLVPGLNLTGSGGNLGILRVRNKIEMFPNDAGTTAASIDLRSAAGAVNINLDGGIGNIDANGAIRVDGANTNVGTTAGGVLRFGAGGSGEAIASKRNATGNQFGLDFYTAGNKRLSITNPGAVGIGTDNPGMSLEVVTGTYYGRPALGVSNGADYAYLHGSAPHSLIWNSTTAMRFGTETARGTGYVEHMRITGTGDVGIGTGSPAAKLDVNGRARVDSLEIVGGADVAEPIDIEGTAETGMVVVIDPEKPGKFRVATEPFDRKVAGVLSGANGLAAGMVLRAEGQAYADGKSLLALSGRVWCWCDADAGAIRPGDLLTTSATPGHAMKVGDDDDAPRGSIIGKAMTPLAEGHGLVLVLVNLQ